MISVRSLVQTLIQKVKHDPSYFIHPDMSVGDLLNEVERRGVALLRAQWRLRRVSGGRMRFAEEKCTIRHRRHCTIGSGSVVEAYARLSCLSKEGFKIGKRVTIGKFAIVECTGVLWTLGKGFSIGDDSSVGDYSFIGAGGGVTIGKRVLMGQRVSMHSQNHLFDRTDVPIQAQGVTSKGIVIEDDCWLGSGSVILDGVNLGRGSVVAAGAVVTKSFPENSVIGGVPAKLLSSRSDADRQQV